MSFLTKRKSPAQERREIFLRVDACLACFKVDEARNAHYAAEARHRNTCSVAKRMLPWTGESVSGDLRRHPVTGAHRA